MLDLTQFAKHRQSIIDLRVEQVVLTGGEPLLNKEFEQIAASLKELGVRVTLLTTGLLLAKKANAIARYVDTIIVSVDGPQRVHDAIRRVSHGFEKIGEGIQAVRALNPSIPISCRTTVHKANHKYLCETVDAAKQMQLDSISFLPADVSSTAFNRDEPWQHDRQDEVALTQAEVIRLESEIETLIERHQFDIYRGYIVESEAKLRRISTRFRERLEGTPPKAPFCNAPWKSAVVDVDGNLRPCFFHAPVANIQQASIQEAINAPAAMSFRQNLVVADDPICQRCVCSLHYKG